MKVREIYNESFVYAKRGKPVSGAAREMINNIDYQAKRLKALIDSEQNYWNIKASCHPATMNSANKSYATG